MFYTKKKIIKITKKKIIKITKKKKLKFFFISLLSINIDIARLNNFK